MSRIRRLIGFGRSVYPSETADRHGRQMGRTPFRRCIQCGWPNDTRKTSWSAEGDGLSDAVDVTVTAVSGQTSQVNTKDRNIEAGCANCGSLHWQQDKPQVLPDDQYLPSDEWGRHRNKSIRRRRWNT